MTVKIALDALGGDYAPAEIVKGALAALNEFDCKIFLVGDKDKIKPFIPEIPEQNRLEIIHAPETISMEENPAKSIRSKKNCSINVGIRLVKEKKADAFISAGNTGACMAGALLGLGRIKGIERPAIATVFPTKVVLLDMGANIDCKPQYLAQFGLMGSIFSQKFLKKNNPRVSLLNIGEEEEKGNILIQEAIPLLKQMPINFIGNLESKDIFNELTDVVVCDGFVGNVILKFGEGLARYLIKLFKQEMGRHWFSMLGTLFMWPVFRGIKKRTDYSAEYGGAPLLGVRGLVMIAHGRAKAKTIKNAVRAAIECSQADVVGAIRSAEQMLLVKKEVNVNE